MHANSKVSHSACTGLLFLFLCLEAYAQAPVIKVQPQSQTVPPGGRVLLSVGATGTGALKYQWHRAGSPVAGGTNVFLELNRLTPGLAGDYRVVVSNSANAVTSSVA